MTEQEKDTGNGQAANCSGARPGDPLASLARAIEEHRDRPGSHSRTAKLLNAGMPKMSQKLIEEAAEVAIEAMRGERELVVHEAADLLYNLTVLLSACGIEPAEVWAEMERREAMMGLAEKLPKEG
jgi:phosphoribosyl-ATP pyrophosphohydrolase